MLIDKNASWLMKNAINTLSGRFCNKGKKCKIPNLPLGSLEIFICEESSPKFQMYNKHKVNDGLTSDKSKCHN